MGNFELVNCEKLLLEEIANPAMKRKDVALTYAMSLRNSQPPNWERVNKAIIARWSFSGLEYIKTQAWKVGQG